MIFIYVGASVLLTWFYPKQLTDVICFGRYRNLARIKKKRTYYLIRSFWMLFFGTICLAMGSAVGLNSAFDNIIHYFELNLNKCDYFELNENYYKNSDREQGALTIRYHVKKNIEEKELNSVIIKIVEDNSVFDYYYKIDKLEVIWINDELSSIVEKGGVLADVEINNTGFLKTITYKWYEEKMDQRKKGNKNCETT